MATLSKQIDVFRDPDVGDQMADSGWDLKEMQKSACLPSVWAESLFEDKPYTPEDYPMLLEAIKFIHPSDEGEKAARKERDKEEDMAFLDRFFLSDVLIFIFT